MADLHPAHPPAGAGSHAPAPPGFGLRLATGLLGVLVAAMMAGFNNRVVAIGLPDLFGQLGWGQDDASWLGSAYSAGELAAMPFATWCAITFSMRRFQLAMLAVVLLIALVLPTVHSLPLMLALRAVQGLCCGSQIPLLMMGALRFLPLSIRLHGLALYAMTATFAPNMSLALAASWLDRLEDWRWLYWQAVPLSALAMVLIAWGIPVMPAMPQRLRQANWPGLLLGISGLTLLALGLDQGAQLDWFHARAIRLLLAGGAVLCCGFLISEWFHPAPFMKLQLLARRNLALGFSLFLCLLVIMLSGASLPSMALGHVQGFRTLQMEDIGLAIGLPQLLLGPMVAMLLYQCRVDARHVFVLGLLCMAAACWEGSGLTAAWMGHDFHLAQLLQAIGQPMAVVSLLFLATSVVQPMEGAYVSGIINTLRAFGTLAGSAMVGRLLTLRTDFHHEMLQDQASWQASHAAIPLAELAAQLNAQASTLAIADVYRVLGLFALLLIPAVLMMQYIPAPVLPSRPSNHG
ncbi:MFS transporter [Aquitalea denitrificans]|uniref:MFS transporter n=1 Tax=Aquitalea denitrificans TaxID=519081 RepID=UPI00135B8ADD|nr:MFS transporter [Aquitalea denitrificans]